MSTIDAKLIYEFSGLPKSGKTTIIDIVSHYFRRKGFRVLVHRDTGTYAPIRKNELGALNIYLASQAVTFLLETYYSAHSDHQLIFIDRGLFDRCVFSETLRELGYIDERECAVVNNFLLTPRLTGTLARVFLFTISPELSLKPKARIRELTRGRSRHNYE